MKLANKKILEFQHVILNHYKKHGRSFAWRNTSDPYAIVVSEIMLQQTQVKRVITKFDEWMSVFPDWNTLNKASLQNILQVWQGMGYNRRAKALRDIAQLVMNNHDGKLPRDPNILKTFPWIGPHTAGSICAFAFNMPTVFIETNVRTVYLYHFFKNKAGISDKQLEPIVTQTVYKKNPRIWYNALMDYGTKIKTEHPNPNRNSKHYTKQSKFEGSNRQIRGTILKHLTQSPHTTHSLSKKITPDKSRLYTIIKKLLKDGMISKQGRSLRLTK